jgi:AcrR family transcriptional regulator
VSESASEASVSPRSRHIAEQAARLFAERGYGATTIDDIGAAAGVSGPAIYWHYAGKQALLAAMLVDISERLLEGGRRCVAESSSDAQAVDRLVQQQVDFALREPDLIVVHARELHHLDRADAHRVRLLQRQYIDVWVDVLERSVDAVPRDHIVAAVQATIGLVNSTPYIGGVPRAELTSMLRSMALAALSGIEPSAAAVSGGASSVTP